MIFDFNFAARLLLLLLGAGALSATAQPRVTPPQNDRSLYLADPTIFQNRGTFYLYGTAGGNADSGFVAYTSPDLKTWKQGAETPGGYALRNGDAYGTKGFWAPQVLFFKDAFYMVYVANEAIAVAKSSSPLGPFTQQTKAPLTAPVKQIDPFVFMDDDGKNYLYHVRLTGGNKLFVAELTDDLSAIKEETLKECITATSPWENTANGDWPVTEGPAVLKHKNWYYLFYTANDFRNPDYATGYAVSRTPYGPWKKFGGNPIVSRKNIGINGTGHGDFIKKGKQLFYVFHTHYSDSVVAPRRTAIVPVRFKKDRKTGIDKVAVDAKRFFYPLLEQE